MLWLDDEAGEADGSETGTVQVLSSQEDGGSDEEESWDLWEGG